MSHVTMERRITASGIHAPAWLMAPSCGSEYTYLHRQQPAASLATCGVLASTQY